MQTAPHCVWPQPTLADGRQAGRLADQSAPSELPCQQAQREQEASAPGGQVCPCLGAADLGRVTPWRFGPSLSTWQSRGSSGDSHVAIREGTGKGTEDAPGTTLETRVLGEKKSEVQPLGSWPWSLQSYRYSTAGPEPRAGCGPLVGAGRVSLREASTPVTRPGPTERQARHFLYSGDATNWLCPKPSLDTV